jgi:serine/threonine-protein kinase
MTVHNASFGFSASGTLVYAPDIPAEVAPVWVDRHGMEESALPIMPDQFFTPVLAPDDERVAVLRRRGADDSQTDLWVLEIARGVLTRLSFDGNNAGEVWTPDGKQLIYVSETTSQPHAIVRIAADGSGTPLVLLNPQERHLPMAITSDGRTLVVRRDKGTGAALASAYLTLSVLADSAPAAAPELLFESRFAMGPLSLSPDGRWAAYESSDSGREEIYVVPFPAADQKWQVSIRGGTEPVWSRSGRELFYRNRDEMMAVRVETSPTFRSAAPETLLSGQRRYRPAYDVDRAGNRFLMLKLADAPPGGFRVRVNWFEELRRRARAN